MPSPWCVWADVTRSWSTERLQKMSNNLAIQSAWKICISSLLKIRISAKTDFALHWATNGTGRGKGFTSQPHRVCSSRLLAEPLPRLGLPPLSSSSAKSHSKTKRPISSSHWISLNYPELFKFSANVHKAIASKMFIALISKTQISAFLDWRNLMQFSETMSIVYDIQKVYLWNGLN